MCRRLRKCKGRNDFKSIESKEHYAHFTITGTFAGEGYTSYNVTSANIEETLKA